MPTLAHLLQNVMKPLAKQRGTKLATIQLNWRAIAGELAADSTPLTLQQGVLTVAVPSASVAQRVQLQAATMQHGLDMLVGAGVVQRLRTRIEPIAQLPRLQT